MPGLTAPPVASSAPAYVRSERRGPVTILTLDHPPVNVLSRPVLERLSEALAVAAADPEARVVVIESAAEKAFAAGADIREMAPLGPAEARAHGRRGQSVTREIERLPLPVIAAVHGACLGGGCELALACDFIVASEDARFGQPEIQLGVMPGWGGTQRLPRRVGASRARRWIYLGDSVSAEEAHRDGLVDTVVPREELRSAAIRLAERLAEKAPVALAAAKYAVQQAIDRGLEHGLDYELELWAALFGTDDQKAGMAAFLERRPFRPGGRHRWKEVSRSFPWARENDPPADVPSGRRKRTTDSRPG